MAEQPLALYLVAAENLCMCHHFKIEGVDDLLFAFNAFIFDSISAGSFYPINLVPVVRQNEDDSCMPYRLVQDDRFESRGDCFLRVKH
jgi:hypothetical protein